LPEFAIDTGLLDDVRQRFVGLNVRWVLGGAGSGKSTVTQEVCGRTPSIDHVDMDAHIYGRFFGRYDRQRHPASCAWLLDDKPLDWILSLPTLHAYDAHQRAMTVEVLDLLVDDLRKTPSTPVLVDGGLTHPSVLAEVLPATRIVVLAVDKDESRRLWTEDERRRQMKADVLMLDDGAHKWETFLACDAHLHDVMLQEAAAAGMAVVHRNGRSVDDVVLEVEHLLWRR